MFKRHGPYFVGGSSVLDLSPKGHITHRGVTNAINTIFFSDIRNSDFVCLS